MVKVFSLYFTLGSWADAIVIQAVADALNLIIHIIQVFASVTNIGPVYRSETDTTVINIGHLDEIHYVSTVAFNEEVMANNVICNNHPAQLTMVTVERQIIMKQ